ncbi:MAG: amidohydrolase [Bacteroidota bacterium]|nr:amidohydrolase [Bacteroidota bacterium]
MPRILLAVCFSVLVTIPATGQTNALIESLDARADEYFGVARQIWEWAELGYQEDQSSQLLMETLAHEGFDVDAGVAGIPTAFVAEYGSGAPVIGILAEYDALPGLSQAARPQQQALMPEGNGHACGHNLFGTASVASAIAVKDWLSSSGSSGTIRVYGTPAEEGGAGKVYLVREGLFDDVDVVLHWHPGDRNDASPTTTLANRSAKFRFYGHSTHAAGAPERGRSALDGVEAMNMMVNMLREHVPQETRIHYVITRGGLAPNVVPDFAEVYYYVRHPLAATLETLWPRVIAAAEGAALGTSTRMDYEIIHGIHSLLPNETLANAVYANLQEVGGITYSAEELEFAQEIRGTLGDNLPPMGSQETIRPYALRMGLGSTDVGDVSYMVPTAGFYAATWVPGTAAHSWQATAAGGMSIGGKGMMLAAKVLSMTAVDLFTTPTLVQQARQEFAQRRGPNFMYRPLLGDRDPPLDYRR